MLTRVELLLLDSTTALKYELIPDDIGLNQGIDSFRSALGRLYFLHPSRVNMQYGVYRSFSRFTQDSTLIDDFTRKAANEILALAEKKRIVPRLEEIK